MYCYFQQFLILLGAKLRSIWLEKRRALGVVEDAIQLGNELALNGSYSSRRFGTSLGSASLPTWRWLIDRSLSGDVVPVHTGRSPVK